MRIMKLEGELDSPKQWKIQKEMPTIQAEHYRGTL